MSDLLSTLWQRADAKEPRFGSDEVAAWPDGAMSQFMGAGLIRQVENASSVVCDACAGEHVEDVTFVQSPAGTAVRAYIYCPEHGRVRVPLERLKQWEVNFDGLSGAIARAMDLAGNKEDIISGRIWFLGKATIAMRSRELFLARGLTWEDARGVLGASARLNAARSALVFAAGEVPPADIWNGDAPPVVALKTVAAFGETGFSVDREHLESLLSTRRKKTQSVPLVSFPTPTGTTWADMRLVITQGGLSIHVKGKHKKYTFQEAGFEERRRKDMPDRLWRLLKTFGMHGGVLPFTAVEEKTRTNLKQYVSDLRDRLAALIPGIEEESISYDKDERSYKTAFRICSEEALQFPTPEGVSWMDVSIFKHGDSGICIAVDATKKFATSDYADEDDDTSHRWTAAQYEGTVERTYDLRMLKLADDQDRPNRAGEALLAVLSGKGAVTRKADDKGMLELGGVLTNLMGMDGSPFRFDKNEKRWVALFDATNETTARR